MPKVNKPKSTDIQEQLAQKLQTLRQQKGVSQSEIAKYIDLTVGAYQNYENGRREANYETLCKLADFYNVSTDYLLGRTIVKQTAMEQPDPFANIDVSALEKRIIKQYTELEESTRALCIELFLKLNPTLNAVFQEITQQSPNPPITQAKSQIPPQPVQQPIPIVQPSPQRQIQQPSQQPNLQGEIPPQKSDIQILKNSEVAVARSRNGAYKPLPTDEQMESFEEVKPGMI